MTRILFVCHGNICRSPMAEFVLKDIVKKRGLEDKFYIESAATSKEEIWHGVGNPIYPQAKAKLREHGIGTADNELGVGDKRAKQTTKSDYEKFDYIIGMDKANIRNMQMIYGEDTDNKIYKMLDFTERDGDVADPWYTGRFDATWLDVTEGCIGLLNKLESEGLI